MAPGTPCSPLCWCAPPMRYGSFMGPYGAINACGVSAPQEGGGPGPLLPQPDAGEPEGEGRAPGVGGPNTYRQGVGAHLGAWGCPCVCAPRRVWGCVCICTRGRGLAHACEGVLAETRACAHPSAATCARVGVRTRACTSPPALVHTHGAVPACTRVSLCTQMSTGVPCCVCVCAPVRAAPRRAVARSPGGAGCPRAVASSLSARSPSSSAR